MLRRCLPTTSYLLQPTRTITTTTASMSDILHSTQGPLGILTLNRPKALNALTTSMVESMHTILTSFDSDPSIAAALIQGTGDKAFCAGGDVKAVVQMAQKGQIEDAMRFFRSEYRTNYKIASFSKPYIAYIDGITMGGGAGVSVHGPFRIATEKTLFAMPECAIGLIPDIGASYFLPGLQLPGVGLYLGLTGARVKGADAYHAGIATHYILSSLLPELTSTIQNTLATLMLHDSTSKEGEQHLRSVLNEFQHRHCIPTDGDLVRHAPTIQRIFDDNTKSLEYVYDACRRDGSDFAVATLKQMQKGSPTSQRLVVEQLKRGTTMPLDECLRMEYRIVHHLVSNPRSDFHSGVDAVLITKSGVAVWSPATVDDVPDVQGYFEPLEPHEELQLEGGSASRL